MRDKIIPSIEKFEEFNNTNIQSAIKELEGLNEGNRIHLQRLVFTDLVNRFDLLLDDLLLKFSTMQSSFSISIIKAMKESPIL